MWTWKSRAIPLAKLLLLFALLLKTFMSLGHAQVQVGPIQPLPSSGAASSTPMAGEVRNSGFRHRDSLGRTCLDISGSSRARVINPNLYDHVVVVGNRCLQLIRVKICYHKADSCLLAVVPGNQRKETILGSLPNVKYFRYDYQEQR